MDPGRVGSSRSGTKLELFDGELVGGGGGVHDVPGSASQMVRLVGSEDDSGGGGGGVAHGRVTRLADGMVNDLTFTERFTTLGYEH
jgi:hypothetical protein